MAGSSSGYHEPPEELGPETRDHHRAISSLMEELEAVDWYEQRARVTSDPELRAILEHNRDEEKEHAVMTLEWLRRRDPALDQQLREILFQEGPIRGEHGDEDHADPAAAPSHADGSLNIGSLKEMLG